MRIDYPVSKDERPLRKLWQEAFGDSDAFLDGFFRHGFSPSRCRSVIEGGMAKSALYWFDCTMQDHRYAYLYAVATAKECRGQGLCRALMENTHSLLKNGGYEGVLLVPGEKSLFAFYEKLGYRTATTVEETTCAASAGNPPVLCPLTADVYATARRQLLPANSVVQEGETLDFLATYARFACTKDFLMAYSIDGKKLICHELLGKADFGSLVYSLGCIEGVFRTPGNTKPFAMFLPLQDGAAAPEYFGLALD